MPFLCALCPSHFLTFQCLNRMFMLLPLMKTTIAFFSTALLLAMSTFAGPDVIIRERAKELSNQNNVRQGVAPPTQPPPSAQPAAAAAPQAPSQAVTRFQSDLAVLKAAAPATPDQKQKLASDLIAMAQGAKPSPAAAAKLAEDLA